jgi:glycosyltransferase involved in cell wall biosynthesis
MRIGVDLSSLKFPLTGVGNYTYYLLEALLRNPRAPTIEGFQGLSWRSIKPQYFERSHSKDRPVSTLKDAVGLGWLREHERARQLYTSFRRKVFEASAGAKSIMLFHAFSFVPPGHLAVPTIPVVYDLSFVRHPDLHPRARVRALQAIEMHLQSAPVIHTISRFSANEITNIYGIEPSRIAIIYPGVKPIFTRPSLNSSAVLARYKLTAGEYFLVVSTLEPRKNLRTLVSAYLKISPALRGQFPLCVVGAAGWNDMDLPDGYENLERAGSLRFLGFVPDAELKALYENARVMLYPSSYEGFGMPIIEALASGTPVACSNTTSLPEAGGTVSRSVAPFDVDAWAEELRHAADQSLSQHKQARQAHALQFTWDRAAEQALDLYAKVLNR